MSLTTEDFRIEDHAGLARFFASKYGDYDSEEANQDALLALWRARRTFDPTKGSFATYAAMWAKAVLRRHRSYPYSMPVGMAENDGRLGPQKERPLVRIKPESASSSPYGRERCHEWFVANGTDAEIMQSEAADEIKYAIKCLPYKWKVVIRGLYLCNLTTDEIKITRQGVSHIHHEALKKMRHHLQCPWTKVG